MSARQPFPYPIRGYTPGDEDALVRLFERTYGKPIFQEHWRWKMKGMDSPVENIWLAQDKEKVIFQYAGIPTPYQLPNGEITAMVSVDTMTDPDYRRQGLLTHVARHTYTQWKEGGISFVIGLPNEQWGSRTKVLGWRPLFRLEWLALPLRPEALLARRVRFPALSRATWLGWAWRQWSLRRLSSPTGLHIKPIQKANSSFDELWKEFSATNLISIVRNQAWLNWRYLQAPGYAYHLILAEQSGTPKGYAVYRLEETAGRKVGFIPEILTSPGDQETCQALLNYLVQGLLSAGAEIIYTLAVPQTALYQTLRSVGFLRGKHSFSVEMVPLQDSLPLSHMEKAQNWWMCGGDFDVI